MSRAWIGVAFLCVAACGPVTSDPDIPDLNGNYSFTLEFTGPCTSQQKPGRCSINPVSLAQVDRDFAIQPLGAGSVDHLAVVFASNKLEICDLSKADLTFAGVFDGVNISGVASGTLERAGFGACTLQNAPFLLSRLP